MNYFSSSALVSFQNTNQVRLEADFQNRNAGISPYLEMKATSFVEKVTGKGTAARIPVAT